MPPLKAWFYTLGLLLMLGIFLAELHFHASATSGYVLLTLGVLALSRSTTESFLAGIIPTTLLLAGFVMGSHAHGLLRESSNYVSDSISVITIWISVVFTIRYRNSIRSENRHREMINSLFLHANEAIIIVNESGNITMANPAVGRTFGYSVDELMGQNIEILVPHSYKEKHQGLRDAFIRNSKSRSMASGIEIFGVRKDETLVPIDVSLSPFALDNETYVVAFILDVTERKIAEQNLRRLNEELEERVASRTQELTDSLRILEDVNGSLKAEVTQRLRVEKGLKSTQRLYAAIAGNFPDGWIGILDENLHYKYARGKGVDGIGINPPDLVGKPFSANGASENALRQLHQCFSDKETKLFEIDCKDHNCEVTALPFANDHDGNEILVVVHDITRQKSRELELITALNRERELGELKSKFVSLASHEFRTPLTTVLSSVFLLENYAGEQFEKMKGLHFNRIKRAAGLLNEILDDFLSLSKLEEDKVTATLTEIDIVNFIAAFVDEIQQHKRPGQTITYSCESNAIIHSDRKLLYNILSNLVGNAIKYSGDNGVIKVELSTHDNSFGISVRDNGIGIPADNQKHLFERFFRGDNAIQIQGTGLGLNITKRYVDLLGGHIDFESSPGNTVFSVTIPVPELTTK